MEQQNELKLGIGTEEAITLKPTTLKIISVEVKEVGEKRAKKVVCTCKHPDAELPIQISSIKYEVKGKLDVSGLWLNLDSKKLIRKGSALATFLQSLGCSTIESLVGKDVMTTTDDKGYLCFKAY